jgi:hydrogenase-4 component B
VVTLAVLALIGGLAAACFAKMLGIVFLGAPRSARVEGAGEPGWAMQGTVLAMAAGCVLLGMLAPAVVRHLEPVLMQLTSLGRDAVRDELARVATTLDAVVIASAGFLLLATLLAALRRGLLAGRPVREGPTWACGYAAVSPRMQYTGSSFGQPLLAVFGRLQLLQPAASLPKGFFPARAAFASATPDLARERLYGPLFRALGRVLARLRWLQHGQVQLYVLYIALTLVALLTWSVGLR